MLLHTPLVKTARFGLAAVVVALTFATPLAPAPLALAQGADANSSCSDTAGPDYPIAGGWFYTQEAQGCIFGSGPVRHRGYRVVDDGQASFWTEFRRYGGTDVLGYPVSQPFHYPVSDVGGMWYQGFERGILQWHPETGRAELANVNEMFTEQNLDYDLLQLGIPLPEPKEATSFATDAERRMGWLTEPRFLARYFFDPVGAHSSDPQEVSQAAFTTQEQAWAFFGLPQSLPARPFLLSGTNQPCSVSPQPPCRVSLDPLVHTFTAQRFQKGGMELFEESPPNETFLPAGWTGNPAYLLDPTIVPGDGVRGCVALTAVGLLARTLGADKIIPSSAVQALPLDPAQRPFVQSFIPPVAPGQLMLQFQLTGTTFAAGEPVTIHLTDANPSLNATSLRSVTSHVTAADSNGAFDQILTARVGTYEITATSDTSSSTYDGILDLTVPTLSATTLNTATCHDVGLPVQGAIAPVATTTPAAQAPSPSGTGPAKPVLTD